MKNRKVWLLFLCFLWVVAFEGKIYSQQTISLNGVWELTYWPQSETVIRDPSEISKITVEKVTAKVPGNVELDLLAAGKVKDPMIGSQVYELRKYEGYQWCYSKKFPTPLTKPGQKIVLSFGGIDCLADIWLNGERIGSTDNMFIEHTFDVTKKLSPNKENLLQVILRSAIIEGQNYMVGPFSLNVPEAEGIHIRKAPHSYGWDIMPRLVSAGLWRDVELQITNPANITNVFWMTAHVDPNNKTASGFVDVQARIPFDLFDKVSTVVSLSYGGKKVFERSVVMNSYVERIPFHLEEAHLWWPRGYGEAALYDAEITLVDEKGAVLSTDKRKLGLRKVHLEMSDLNDENSRFCFIVNGEPVFVRGTNWVPLDAFHSRDISWVQSTIDMVADVNCNMIRCWGGNVYEDHAFYNLCDERGIMIWQDFAMGCTFYPQGEEFAQKIEKEILSVVLKLRNHSSIVLWSGNNEDDLALTWTLRAFNINPNKDEISRVVIPKILYEFDPTRPYLPSSPYYSQAVYERGNNEDDLPENHLWGPRGYYKDSFYTQAKAKFVSEIGYHGCPNRESLEKMFTKEAVYPWTKDFEWNDEWLTKAVRTLPTSGKFAGRNNLMLNQITLMFGDIPKDLDTFIEASQFIQAEAMKYFVEKWRGAKFDKTGIIWWNIKDGWPIISDAIVDYYNSKKMAYYFLKNAHYDVCVMINDPVNEAYQLVVANDTREASKGIVTVTDIASGKVLFKDSFSVEANNKSLIASIPEQKGQGILLIQYEIDGTKRQNHYLYGAPPFQLKEYKQLLKKTKIYTNIN